MIVKKVIEEVEMNNDCMNRLMEELNDKIESILEESDILQQ